MATVELMTDRDAEAVPAVKAVFDDIRAVRKSDFINNFWRALAHDPAQLARIWGQVKAIMGSPGALDPLTRDQVIEGLVAAIAPAAELTVAPARGPEEGALLGGKLSAIRGDQAQRLPLGHAGEAQLTGPADDELVALHGFAGGQVVDGPVQQRDKQAAHREVAPCLVRSHGQQKGRAAPVAIRSSSEAARVALTVDTMPPPARAISA